MNGYWVSVFIWSLEAATVASYSAHFKLQHGAIQSKLVPSNSSHVQCSFSNENAVILAVPIDGQCPEACPFMQLLPGDPCSAVCVPAIQCAEFHPARGFADEESMECLATCGSREEDLIAGCEVCAGRGKCAKCLSQDFQFDFLFYNVVVMMDFVLSSDGKSCNNPASGFWYCLYVLGGFLVIVVIYYAIMLAWRDPTNADNLEKGLDHRHRCRPLLLRPQERQQAENAPAENAPREKTLMEWTKYTWSTNVHRENISGIGVILYFNMIVFLGVVALVVWLACQAAFAWSARDYERVDRLEDSGCRSKHRVGVVDEPGTLEDKSIFEYRMFFCLGIAYIVVLLGSWLFFIYQRRRFKRFHSDKTRPFLSDFTVVVQKLPADATDEGALLKLFDGMLGSPDEGRNELEDRVVGVSICYALGEYSEEVEKGIEAWVVEREDKERIDNGGVPTTEASGRMQSEKNVPAWQLHGLDSMLGLVPDEDKRPNHAEDKRRILEVMKNIKCAGTAFIVLSNEKAVQQLRKALQENPVRQVPLGSVSSGEASEELEGQEKASKECKLEYFRPSSEPLSVYWRNFVRPEEDYFWRKMVMGIPCIFGAIAVWAALYLPYALEYTRTMRVPGQRPSLLADLLLGALIGIGNTLVGNVIEFVVDRAGFLYKDRRDVAVLGLAFFANLLNVVADVWMTMQVAKGTMLDEAFEGDNVGYDRVVVHELFALIVPGYLFVPYLIQPVVECVLPYCLYRWLVRSDSRFMQREAEKALEPPEFDLVWRYADALNNFVICFLLLLFVTPHSCAVMLWLFAFVVFVYFMDKLRLFHHSQTFYTTQIVSIAFQFWWVIPTSVLAGVVAWWGHKAGVLVHDQSTPLKTISFFVMVHVFIYLSVVAVTLQLFVPKQSANDDDDTPRKQIINYDEAIQNRRKNGKGWDYFTGNPGHCLRTWGKEDERDREFTCVRGKMYLLPWRNWDLGGGSRNFTPEVYKAGIFSNALNLP